MTRFEGRKNIRLKDYDYSQGGYYFVTICTKDRCKFLSKIVTDDKNAVEGGFHAAPKIQLSLIGKEILKTIDFINNQYSNVSIDKHIIMPNHIHLIIVLQESKEGGHGNPPLHKIIAQLKSYTNKKFNDINKTKNLFLWQKNYFEHIIRNEQEYEEIWQYIETNPLKWEEDKYYN